MTVGELVLETLSTGVITEDEVTWLTDHLQTFTRPEEAAAIRLILLVPTRHVGAVAVREAPRRGAVAAGLAAVLPRPSRHVVSQHDVLLAHVRGAELAGAARDRPQPVPGCNTRTG